MGKKKSYATYIHIEESDAWVIRSICDVPEIAKEHLHLIRQGLVENAKAQGIECEITTENDGWRIFVHLKNEAENFDVNVEIYCEEYITNILDGNLGVEEAEA